MNRQDDNGSCFLHTKSRKIKYFTVDLVTKKDLTQTKQVLGRIFILYTNRGFAKIVFHCDNAFSQLNDHVGEANMDIVGRGEHVPTIKSSIRTIKERCRSIIASLPYCINQNQ